MSKKIKKQIRRSLPVFVIISLIISTVAVGLFFNFDLNIYRLQNNIFKVSLGLPTAQADSSSTVPTEVEVRNAPPKFTVAPAESPASTSTTPVNYGSSITFNATASDAENNEYYLIVCKTDAVTASTTGGTPHCDSGQLLCVSGLKNSTVQNACTYSNVNEAAETQDWYAFVCDNHPTEGACSTASQGTGDSGSPFYINHAPTIDAVSATVDNQPPGGVFTFTATSTDSDNARGGDSLQLFICDNSGWASTTGCLGTTYCTSTAQQAVTNQAVDSCDWTSNEPAAHQTYQVYAYIDDQFDLGGTNNGTTTSYTIINVAPVVQDVYLVPTSGTMIVPNIKDAPPILVTATSTNVSDKNGCSDLDSATATGTVYWSGVSGGPVCTPDNNYCYQIDSSNCTVSNCSGEVADVICTTTLQYIAYPTDSNSNASTTIWKAAITVSDGELHGTGTSSPGTEVYTTTAIGVNESLIDYGTLVAGHDTGTTTATTTVVDYGNSPIDSYISGTDMVQAPYSFGANYQEFSTSTNFLYAGPQGISMSSTTPYLLNLNIHRPTNINVDELNHVYWGIGVPAGQMSGVYNGVNTFTVSLDSDGTW